jgi:glycerol-3-phosphate dehydrogenase subunit C
MFKQELPLMFPDDADVQAVVKAAMFDPFEYFVAAPQGRPAEDRFQGECRWARSATTSPATLRVQNVGQKTEEMLKLTGAGTHGQHRRALLGPRRHLGREEYYELSMKIGKPVFKAMAKDEPD